MIGRGRERPLLEFLMKTLPLLLTLTVCLGVASTATAADGTDSWKFLQARLAAAEGDFDRGITLMDELVRANPDDPYAAYERAEMLLEAGRTDRAVAELRRTAARFPELYEAQRLLGRILLDQARGQRAELENALFYLRRAWELRPTDTTSGMIVFQVLASIGQNEQALEVIEALAERNPDNPMVNLNLATVLSRLGRAAEARSALERVVAVDSGNTQAILQLVEIYQQSGDWQKAAAVLEDLARQDPINRDLQRQLGYFHLRAGNPQRAEARFRELYDAEPLDKRHRFFLAEALNDLERYDEAEELYRGLLAEEPNDAEFLVSLGLNLMGQRRFDDAATVFERLLALPDLPQGIQMLGKTQLATIEHFHGDYDEALRRAREVVRGPRGVNSAAVSLVLDVYRKQKDYAAAIQFLEPMVAESPSELAVQARYLEFLLRAGRYEDAEPVIERITSMNENGSLVVAQIYTDVELHDRALAILEPLHRADSASRPIAFQLGASYERAGRIKDAEAMFLAILDRNPEDAATLNYLGYMWADRNENLERARDMIERAVQLDPRNAAYLDSLGWVYFRLNDLEQAEKYLLDAATIMPWDPTIQEHVGDLFARQGRYGKALEHYRIALRLEPPAEDGEKIRTKIAEAERKDAQTSN